MYKINKGMPDLGCHLKGNGANFGLFASNVQKVLLNIYKDVEDSKAIISIELDRNKESKGDFFYIFIEEIKEGMGYEWRIWQEESWSKPLIDPYAYSLREYPQGSNQFRNIVVQVEPYKGTRPDIPWEDTILYELHVGAFTKQIKDYKGTFKGLMEKLPYLKDLGITTLELLPVFKWNEYTLEQKNPLTGERMKDIWG
ncbi:MAG: alpha-amylase family glycosyl hydrolase, partial [Cellulosilyticaceae bacterium]